MSCIKRAKKLDFKIPFYLPSLRLWLEWWRAGIAMRLSGQRCCGDFKRSARQQNSPEASSRKWVTWIRWH